MPRENARENARAESLVYHSALHYAPLAELKKLLLKARVIYLPVSK
jgi:hypothetical protein